MFGPDHVATIRSLYGLACSYFGTQEYDRAETVLVLLVGARERVNGRYSPATVFDRELLVRAYLGLGRYPSAEVAQRECLHVREHNAPEEWQTSMARAILGDLLVRQRKFQEAEPLLLSGYEGMKQREDKIPKEFKHHLTTAVRRLVHSMR